MIHVTINDLRGLKDSIATLENVLETLDMIGAGIAAIHVDAAVNQLRNNLDTIAQHGVEPDGLALACQSEVPPYLP